ncbi:hypothetical protein QTP70_027796, partial [Hemibagrus guttatus]
VGCELEEKERFWSELDVVMESIPTGERVVIGVDFNGHVGEGNTGDEEVMGKFGVKERNLEGQMVVDFAKRMDMAVVNTYFQKREEHRVTYKSGGRRTQVVIKMVWTYSEEGERRHFHPRSRGHVSSNLIYPPLLSQSQTVVVGGLWNCQSAVRKADFISALASHYSFDFLALTETWIPPQNTATPAALSSAYTFSHSPRESGRGGGTGLLLSQRWCSSPLPLSHLTISSFEFHAVSVTSPINLFIIVIYHPPGPLGNFLDEMDTLLNVFPSDSTPLTVLGDFNLPSDKLHSSGLLALLNSFSLSFNSCPPTHKEGNVLDLVFTHPSPATDMTVTPLHISNHHLVSFSITLPVLPKRNSQLLLSPTETSTLSLLPL